MICNGAQLQSIQNVSNVNRKGPILRSSPVHAMWLTQMTGLYVLIVLAVVFWMCRQGKCDAEQCVNASQDMIALTCTFHVGLCGWSSTGSDAFAWKRDSWISWVHYLAAEGGSSGSRAVLASPSVCPTGDSMLQLQFGYYMGQDESRCQLTVSVQTDYGTSVIETLRSHHESGFIRRSPFYIACPKTAFQVIFEAKKMVDDKCGPRSTGVYIDDIHVDLVPGTQASVVTCPTNATHPPIAATTSTPVTTGRVGSTSTPVTTSRGGSTLASTSATAEVTPRFSYSTPNATVPIAGPLKPPTPDDGGLSGGAVAGIVISVLVIVAAIVIVVIVFIWRRKGQSDKSTTSPEHVNSPSRERAVSLAVANSAYDPDLLFSAAPTSAQSLDKPRASTYYSTATPADDAPTNPRRDKDGYEEVTTPNPGTAGNPHRGQMIGSPATSNEGRARGLKDRKGKGANPKEDEYNALSFELANKTAPSSGAGHYDHFNGTEEGPDSYNELSFGAEASVESSVGGADYDHVQDSRKDN